jgi:predicted P-loop ATPase
MSAKQEPKKSVRDYLDALVWDHKARIERWLIDYAGASDTPYVRAVSRVILVAAVRRVRQPGCKFDELLILEGPQGVGKSSALRALAGNDDWFTDDLPLDGRALVEATAGKWIVEAGELNDATGGMEPFKACLSRQVDEVRLPYERERTRVPRAFVIVGTTGTPNFLSDATGNRRFWPVHVACFDLERLRADRDQLWAEAVVAEAAGASIRFADVAVEQSVVNQL